MAINFGQGIDPQAMMMAMLRREDQLSDAKQDREAAMQMARQKRADKLADYVYSQAGKGIFPSRGFQGVSEAVLANGRIMAEAVRAQDMGVLAAKETSASRTATTQKGAEAFATQGPPPGVEQTAENATGAAAALHNFLGSNRGLPPERGDARTREFVARAQAEQGKRVADVATEQRAAARKLRAEGRADTRKQREHTISAFASELAETGSVGDGALLAAADQYGVEAATNILQLAQTRAGGEEPQATGNIRKLGALNKAIRLAKEAGNPGQAEEYARLKHNLLTEGTSRQVTPGDIANLNREHIALQQIEFSVTEISEAIAGGSLSFGAVGSLRRMFGESLGIASDLLQLGSNPDGSDLTSSQRSALEHVQKAAAGIDALDVGPMTEQDVSMISQQLAFALARVRKGSDREGGRSPTMPEVKAIEARLALRGATSLEGVRRRANAVLREVRQQKLASESALKYFDIPIPQIEALPPRRQRGGQAGAEVSKREADLLLELMRAK